MPQVTSRRAVIDNPSITPLDNLVAEAVARLEAGEPLDVAALTADCPELREPLEKLLPTLAAMVDLGHAAAAADVEHKKNGAPRPAADSPKEFSPPPRGEGPGEGGGILGDFRILREIGRGGMGVVYEAEQISLGRSVALKVLPFAAMLDSQQLARFKNEARAAATLKHPNIVSVYSVGSERGVHYYAMELIEGNSLAEVIAAMRKARDGIGSPPPCGTNQLDCPPPPCGEGLGEGVDPANQPSTEDPTIEHRSSHDNPPSPLPLPPSTLAHAHLTTLHAPCSSLPAISSHEYFQSAAKLGLQAAEALQHAHDQGILHRDIKPGNLLIQSAPSPLRGGLGRGNDDASHPTLFVTDFGLARIEADAGMTMTGDLIGTLRYMAPEQALAKRVVIDHRADVYSLGATLYELLTLQPAFGESDRSALLKQIAFEDPRPLRKVDRRIPAELETIVLKALEKNPDERYQTAGQLADDLRAFLENRTIKAKPPTLVGRAKKWSRRHKPLVTSAAAATVAIVLISFGVLASSNVAIEREQQKTIAALEERTVALQERTDALTQAEKNFEAAQAERRSAQEKAAEVNATVNFLITDVFGATAPARSLNREITVKEALAAAETKISTAFARQPLLEASIRWTVGQSFAKLEDYVSAEQQFLRASEIRTEHLGPDHRRTIETNVQRIIYLVNLGKDQEAQELGNKTLADCERVLGPAHRTTLLLMGSLGYSLGRAGKVTESALILNRKFELARDAYGPDNEFVLESLERLAISARVQVDIESIEKIYQNARLVQQTSQKHLTNSTSAIRLAGVFWSLKKLDEAEALYRDTLKMPLHAAHPDVLECRRALTALAAINGRWQEAADQMAQLWQNSKTAGEFDGGLDCLRYSPILIRIPDSEAFEQFRREALGRFGATHNPLNAERVCRACLLLPADEELLNQFGRLHESLLNGQEYWSVNGESTFQPWGSLALALLEYRRGNWQKCADWCKSASPNKPSFLEAMVHLVMAMTQHQLHEDELAQASLASANTIIRSGYRAGQWSNVGSGWFDWEFALILRDEARQLIEAEKPK